MDSKFTPDGSLLVTLFKDSSLYFWNLSTFDPDHKITTTEQDLNLTCFDISWNFTRIISGGWSRHLILWEVNDFFSRGHLHRWVYRLPEGFNSVKKVKFIGDSQRIAILSEGVFLMVKISDDSLEIEFSIKLPLRAIVDFDIDYYNYYLSLIHIWRCRRRG